jgi:hypothetical protein
MTTISQPDARVLRSTDPIQTLTADRIGQRAGVQPDVALSCLRRMRGRYLVEDDYSRPAGWVRLRLGDVALEHAEPEQ